MSDATILPPYVSGRVLLVAPDPRWPALFAEAAARMRDACGDALVAVEHIGSTSVPGLAAKPVIDIMPLFADESARPRVVAALTALGYVHKGESGIPRRSYFGRRTDPASGAWKHNVHAFVAGDAFAVRHLVFRDALRADASVREAYERLKRELAARFPDDVEAYAEAKGEFVDRVIAAAGGPPRPERG